MCSSDLYNCQEKGHYAKDCDKPKNERPQKEAKVAQQDDKRAFSNIKSFMYNNHTVIMVCVMQFAQINNYREKI